MNMIRLAQEEINAVLDRLDAIEPSYKVRDQPQDRTYPYRRSVILHSQSPGRGAETRIGLSTRMLSKSSLTGLCGGFLHVGTACGVQLTTRYGTWIDVSGKVEQCKHVERTIHEIRFRFDKPIHPPMLAREAADIRALVVDDCPLNVILAKAHLEALRVTVETAENGAQAVEKTLNSRFDLILMDIEMPGLDGCDATKALRNAGYFGVIAAVSAHTDEDSRARCRDAGFNLFLAKPYARDDLLRLLNAVQDEPLFSSMSSDHCLGEAINAFVNELRLKSEELEKAVVEYEFKSIQTITQWLRINGTAFGFQPISDMASRIQLADDTGELPGYRQEELVRLVRLCRQAQAVAGVN